ncbi:E3 ubiquitin-protein ligase MYCBP2-like isoform X3 [Dreissena polymorpha]|uniref:E3 ubiquitin-protein ligase MYCBP2-like isoform X3 n=1 Tax=Dreissena polymorpha TaxID=45954 RepID=UPI00226525C4|nr:E3 ubiquitin-protein ligase MYCBP2-like isoform X3 [Dreissena polymorpha]
MKITIEDGILAKFKADVLVNSVNQMLMLKSGKTSGSILREAGPDIQKECARKYPNGIAFGDIAVTKAYKLQCKSVYHVAMPAWDTPFLDPHQILCQTVCNCLERAHADKMSSMALPALGCGFLNFPPDVVMDTISECVSKFEETRPKSTLNHVIIVIYNQGSDGQHIKQKFTTSQRRHHELSTKRLAAVKDFSITCRKETSQNACGRVLVCGHGCVGYKNEPKCPPCVHPTCYQKSSGLTQSGEDDCSICYTDELREAPVVMLQCGHLFHLHCTRRVLENKWVGHRLNFTFMLCPLCKAYFGGAALCEGGAADGDMKREELICPACAGPQMVQNCPTHGTDYIEYKCRYCCSVAIFFCFGNTHFCNTCHATPYHTKCAPCPAGPGGRQLTGKCPLGVRHAPNGEECCLGCGLCANLQSF